MISWSIRKRRCPATQKGTGRACDIVITYVGSADEHQILRVAECKRAQESTLDLEFMFKRLAPEEWLGDYNEYFRGESGLRYIVSDRLHR